MAGEANNVNPGLLLLLIASILTVFSVFFTTIRVLRRYQRQALGWDDYTILPATILAIGRTITQIVSVPRGNGKHRSELSVDDYQFVNFCGYVHFAHPDSFRSLTAAQCSRSEYDHAMNC